MASTPLGRTAAEVVETDSTNRSARNRTMRIQPSGSRAGIDTGELWRYRGMFMFLIWRDIKVRYAQTVLGASWAILQPLLTVAIFTVIFGAFARIPSDGIPYPVFSLAGMVPWTYFAAALAGAGNSLITDRNLITKTYFPRLVIPYATVLAGLVDFGIALLLLLALMLFYGLQPAAMALIMVPLLLAGMVLTVAGVGCWLAALNIQYRDIRYVIPFLIQAWMYASPIVYPASIIPAKYQYLYALNPMVGVIEGMRAVLLRARMPDTVPTVLTLAVGAVLFITGSLYFRRTERLFADVA